MEEFNNVSKKYNIEMTSRFKKDYKKIRKQNKNVEKLVKVVYELANGNELDEKYKNHKLIDDKEFKNCMECHIEPDWLLVYKIQDNELILLLFATGSHSDLFKK